MHNPKSALQLFLSFAHLEKWRIILLIFLNSLSGLVPSIDSLLLKSITDQFTQIEFIDSSYAVDVMHFVMLYGFWWGGLNLLERLNDYVYLNTFPVLKSKIIESMYNTIQFYDQSFFQSKLVGGITNRITEAARSFEVIYCIVAEKIVRKLCVIICGVLVMSYVNAQITIIFCIWMFIFILLNIIFAKKINNYSSVFAKNNAMVAGRIVDAISNMPVIRMFTSQKFERRYLLRYLDPMVTSHKDMCVFMLKLRAVLGTVCAVMIALMIYYLFNLRLQKLITTGDCVLVLSLIVAVLDDVWDITQEIGDLFEETGSFKQSVSLINDDDANSKEVQDSLCVTEGEIIFKNVTFNYGSHSLFNNKSLVIEGKKKVGLIGFSGSGKTTFVNLIAKIYPIQEGAILIDGQDISKVSVSSLRKNISFIPQEPILFHRTVMENIRYGNQNASDKEAVEAARLAHAHDFIELLPEGYHTVVGERGGGLSGGQRQRIIIARAILKNAPILILDEATSSLDSRTEALIQQSLHFLMQDKTVIVIAHRLSTILDMDQIFVFAGGRIEAQGTHQELIYSSDLYRTLWNSSSPKNIF
ncbi:ABC transporter ATP-binding/permease protein [Rickettsiales endosymbiont of Paramecium tredecaurelia]|nr:ABC transporter ATP-binding/permease protein [Candidatus Sarmatiella mevalonica]